MLLALGSLFRGAADQREVHEPIAAEGRCSDAVLALEHVELSQIGLGEDWVRGAPVLVVDPLDVVEARLACTGKLFAPRSARKRLEAAVFRRGEAALHDAISVGHGAQAYIVRGMVNEIICDAPLVWVFHQRKRWHPGECAGCPYSKGYADSVKSTFFCCASLTPEGFKKHLGKLSFPRCGGNWRDDERLMSFLAGL